MEISFRKYVMRSHRLQKAGLIRHDPSAEGKKPETFPRKVTSCEESVTFVQVQRKRLIRLQPWGMAFYRFQRVKVPGMNGFPRLMLQKCNDGKVSV